MRLEEEQLLKAARKHCDLSLFTKHSSREVKAVKAILAALESEMPKTFEQLRKAVTAINTKMKPEESTLTEEVTLTNKKIHEKYTELFQKDIPPQDERYISNDKLASTLRKSLGYEGDRKKTARGLKFTLTRLIHDIYIFELFEDLDVEPPEEEEPQEPEKKGLEQYTG